MIEVKSTLGGLEQTISRLKKFDKAELEVIIANTITHNIQTDTGDGIDINGKKFKPYTEAYAKYGRRKKGLQTDPVDLRVTGDMLNSLVAKKEGIITTLTVSEDQKKKAEGNSRYRKFIGISTKTRQSIMEFVKQYIGSILK